MKVLTSEITNDRIDDYLEHKWPVLMLVGARGANKKRIVNNIAADIVSKARITQDVLSIDPESTSISIDDARNVKTWVKLKHVSNDREGYRLIVLHNAERMTIEAQNALLKLLENTPPRTLFVLTVTQSTSLLDTLASRAQKIQVVSPSLSEALQYYSDKDEFEVRQAYQMTGALPRYIDEILNNTDSSLCEIMIDAKKLMVSSKFLRLARVDQVIKTYPLDMYIFGLKRINKALLAVTEDPAKLTPRLNALRYIVEAEDLLRKTHPNQKLLLTNLFLHL